MSTVSGASVVATSRWTGDVAAWGATSRAASWGRGRRGVVGAGGRAVGDVARAGVACAGCPRRGGGPGDVAGRRYVAHLGTRRRVVWRARRRARARRRDVVRQRYVPPRRVREEQHGAARFLCAQETEGLDGGFGAVDGESVGGCAEPGRDVRLVAGGDAEQFGRRSEQSGEPVARREEGAGAVLAAQAEREGVASCLGRGAGTLRRRRGVAGVVVRGVGLGAGAACRLVALLARDVARVEPLDLGAQSLVLLVRDVGAFPGLVARRREAFDLGARRCRPTARGGHLALETSEALAAVGEGAAHVAQAALLDGELTLQLAAVRDGVLQGAFGGFERLGEFRLLLTDARRLALQVLRVASATFLGRYGRRARDACLGEADGAADTLREARQLVPRVLRALKTRRQGAYRLLQARLAGERGLERALRRLLALLERGLVGEFGVERAAQRDEVVGEQPQARVAQIGLDDSGAARDGGLAAEGFELAAQFVGEVLDAGEVGAHRVEFSERLLLALAVLEDARGFLDEGAASHRVGMEDGVELSLADDDVHLAADAGVGEEFLDVEEAAGVPVDLVLAAPVAEHRPRDRDLGVLDGEGAVAVVDRERDLGTPQRRPARRAGEDDVLHLAAAQRFGALLAHHPRQRVHDVGLAGAVRPDDARDPRLEPQRRRGGEGFEPTQSHGLEVHAAGLYRPGSARRRPTTRAARRDGGRRGAARRGTTRRRGTGRGTSRRATPVRSAARRHVVSRCVVDEASRHVTSRRRVASPTPRHPAVRRRVPRPVVHAT
ncbi:hypothetical protein GA0115251_106811 [Streptomyces sp. TverLS-915]|nr:hypothetical protein GA0115251_106811 [Streptomyces sp. TverLS-915]